MRNTQCETKLTTVIERQSQDVRWPIRLHQAQRRNRKVGQIEQERPGQYQFRTASPAGTDRKDDHQADNGDVSPHRYVKIDRYVWLQPREDRYRDDRDGRGRDDRPGSVVAMSNECGNVRNMR